MALSVSEMSRYSGKYYGNSGRSRQAKENLSDYVLNEYHEYVRDCAVLEIFSSVVLSAFAEAVGDEEFEKFMRFRKRQYGHIFMEYLVQYVDKCNIEYLKTDLEKRPKKLLSIARRFVNHPQAYRNMVRDFNYSASKYRYSVHELSDPRMKYPEDIEW